MNTLATYLAIIIFTIVFVNVVLFGSFNLSLQKISLGNLLLIQAGFVFFSLFLFSFLKRKM